jgi:hypothetical protein
VRCTDQPRGKLLAWYHPEKNLGYHKVLHLALNCATYFADDQGRIACCGLDYADSYWFDDGYGDHIRHYLWAMGAIPEFAPAGENHVLRSSSVVTHVAC